MDIDNILSTRLEELQQKFPTRFSKSIYVLKAVHDNVPTGWKERLIEARRKGNGQRVILIPYNIEGLHWIGILLKFETDRKIELAQLMDPVEYSDFSPEKLGNELKEIYPDTLLRWTYVEKHRDVQQSASITIKNLLKAAEEVQLTYERGTDTCSIDLKDENWQAALTTMKILFKELSSLNMQELFTLIEEADKVVYLIKDKNIILFFGITGSGKSTTIHFLAGSQMERVIVTTSPFAQSETRYITAVTVNFKDVGAFTDGSIILCDNPGFGNTHRAEFDIANAIGIVRAVKGCRSVKPVVLISYGNIANRCCDVKELAHAVGEPMPRIKDHIETFFYIFTKFPDDEKGKIHELLRDINCELTEEEKSDTNFRIVLKDMLHKTRRSALALNPIKDQPGEILDELAESLSISHPDEAFEFYIAK
ncbi:unnamed protein product, partial [Rotaria sp. Silwood2]